MNLSVFIKKFNFENIFIFYPSIRHYIACKIAGIKNIYHYPLFKKKNLHLVNAAKTFTEQSLNIKNCPTETQISLNSEKIKKYNLGKQKKIVLGIGSSGPTTRWGYNNFASLINKFNNIGDYHFYLVCGKNEEEGAIKIINQVKKGNCESLSSKDVSEIIYYIYLSDIFIGNDSFGHHVSSQMNKPSFVILLDTPKAYSDYSKNQFRIIPPGADINKITHGSSFDPDSITVEMIINKVKNFI